MGSRGVNKCMFIGNLGRDPEMRYTPSGKAVTTFSIAVNRSRKDDAGQQHEQTTWVNCVAWERLAEICAEYLKKGKQVYVEGRLQNRSWDGADGAKHYKTEIVVTEMVMLGDGKGAAPGGEEEEAGVEEGEGAAADEDLPF